MAKLFAKIGKPPPPKLAVAKLPIAKVAKLFAKLTKPPPPKIAPPEPPIEPPKEPPEDEIRGRSQWSDGARCCLRDSCTLAYSSPCAGAKMSPGTALLSVCFFCCFYLSP